LLQAYRNNQVGQNIVDLDPLQPSQIVHLISGDLLSTYAHWLPLFSYCNHAFDVIPLIGPI